MFYAAGIFPAAVNNVSVSCPGSRACSRAAAGQANFGVGKNLLGNLGVNKAAEPACAGTKRNHPAQTAIGPAEGFFHADQIGQL